MRRPDINSRPGKTEADPVMVTSSDIIEKLNKAIDFILEYEKIGLALDILIDLRQDFEEMK